MHFSYFVLASTILAAHLALADRGTNQHNTPQVCNNEPDSDPTTPGSKRRSLIERRVSNKRDTLSSTRAKRGGSISFDANCDAAPGSNSKYNANNGFPTRKSVILQAWEDARTLASQSQNADGSSKAFKHYFGGVKTDVQLDHFKKMMTGVANDDHLFNIQFECSGTGGDCPKANSVANTDASAGGADDQKVIHICEPFWSAPSTRYLLFQDGKTDTPPFRDTSSSGWCNMQASDKVSTKVEQFFATAGHTILHELTHLHALASFAGLEPPEDGPDAGRAGTDDAQDDSQDGCELDGARNFLNRYKRDNGAGNVASPDYNAESYAAAATEQYFMNLCQFAEIRPRTFDDN